MVGYHPVVHTTAERELNDLDADERERLKTTLRDVAETREPTSHPRAKKLEGQPGLFRVRVGDLRAVLELQKPNLCILRVGHRANVYDVIDEIDDRRASA